MIYILILVVSSGFRNIAVTSPEFTSVEACRAAGQAAQKTAEYVSWTCVPKGDVKPQ